MLDPKEQKKGGFGATAARKQEQGDAHGTAPAPDAGATDDATGAVPDQASAPQPRPSPQTLGPKRNYT